MASGETGKGPDALQGEGQPPSSASEGRHEPAGQQLVPGWAGLRAPGERGWDTPSLVPQLLCNLTVGDGPSGARAPRKGDRCLESAEARSRASSPLLHSPDINTKAVNISAFYFLPCHSAAAQGKPRPLPRPYQGLGEHADGYPGISCACRCGPLGMARVGSAHRRLCQWEVQRCPSPERPGASVCRSSSRWWKPTELGLRLQATPMGRTSAV